MNRFIGKTFKYKDGKIKVLDKDEDAKRPDRTFIVQAVTNISGVPSMGDIKKGAQFTFSYNGLKALQLKKSS